jgi:hypothetical protein
MVLNLLKHQWPQRFHSKFLLLPGGFISVDWPVSWAGRFGWASRAGDVALPMEHAAEAVAHLMSDAVRGHATGKVDIVAIGIDLKPDKATNAYAELVALYNVNTKAVAFTGKSMPHSNHRTLVRVVDLSTHFMRIARERVLALGCHDLNIFSPRGRGVQSPNGHLDQLRREMDERVGRFQPTVVLQLPHGTDTPNTWRAAWRTLVASYPSIRSWASAISYFRTGDGVPRAPLSDVLAGTHGGESCVDLIC